MQEMHVKISLVLSLIKVKFIQKVTVNSTVSFDVLILAFHLTMIIFF